MNVIAAVRDRDDALVRAAGYRCPHCRAVASVGMVVRVAHYSGCPRRGRVMRRVAEPTAVIDAQGPPCRQAPSAACAPGADPAATAAGPGGSIARHRHRARRRAAEDAPQQPYRHWRGGERVRPGRWFISGARVLAGGVAGTARRLVGYGRTLLVAVILDGERVARLFSLDELFRLHEMRAAA